MPSKATTREILVILNDGKKRLVLDIPADAKVTYGPVQPGGRDNYERENALRIYTSQQNQLAVFTGVKEFRDLSLTVKEQRVTRKAKSSSVQDRDGLSEESQYEEFVEWDDNNSRDDF